MPLGQVSTFSSDLLYACNTCPAGILTCGDGKTGYMGFASYKAAESEME